MGAVERIREHHEQQAITRADAGASSPEQAALREEGARLLDVSDDIIERTLSGNSEAFLRASRQEGGE